jgi:2-polyprenyl-6-methoxyphenol hydroxylase-like FAD-dependent oxidoreductase
VTANFNCTDGTTRRETGSLLIGADGIRSTVRAQMYPDEGPPRWNGAVMWRGVSEYPPVRTSNSFVLIGELSQRFVCYPISRADRETGLATLNWIAERTIEDDGSLWKDSDWNKRARIDEFLPAFLDWDFGWIDVAKIIRSAKEAFVYPMVDRDPVSSWVDGRVLLIGDAAHAMYPTGSNGASQAIVDARLLGAKFMAHGMTGAALRAYEADCLQGINELILRNRGAGPIGLLGIVEARSDGRFDDIEDVIPRAEAEAYMASYKSAAGFARDTLNATEPLIDRKHFRFPGN